MLHSSTLGGETATDEFCLVQCVSARDPNDDDDDSWGEEDARKVGVGSYEMAKHILPRLL